MEQQVGTMSVYVAAKINNGEMLKLGDDKAKTVYSLNLVFALSLKACGLWRCASVVNHINNR